MPCACAADAACACSVEAISETFAVADDTVADEHGMSASLRIPASPPRRLVADAVAAFPVAANPMVADTVLDEGKMRGPPSKPLRNPASRDACGDFLPKEAEKAEKAEKAVTVIIHGIAYDISNFHDHPGGPAFLELVGGRDATTHFEMHHMRIQRAKDRLRQLPLVGKSKGKADNDWDWSETGFYATVRRRAAMFLLSQVGHAAVGEEEVTAAPTETWRRATSSTMAMRVTRIFAIALYLGLFAATCRFRSLAVASACGVMTAVMGGFGHNALHQRGGTWDTWLFNLAGFDHNLYRSTHVEHHAFPNTPGDPDTHELSPLVEWGPPRKASALRRTFWLLAFHGFSAFLGPSLVLNKSMRLVMPKVSLLIVLLSGWWLAPSAELSEQCVLASNASYASSDCVDGGGGFSAAPMSILHSFTLWTVLWASASSYFMLVTSVTHNQEHNWTAERQSTFNHADGDWGEWQLATSTDIDIPLGLRGVPVCGMMLIFLHEQALHHLFPAIDHSQLHALRPLVSEAAREFGLELRPPQSYSSLYFGMLGIIAGVSMS